MEVTQLLQLAAAFAGGAAATWLLMDRRRLTERISALEQTRRHAGEELRLSEGQRLANMLRLVTLATRDNIDALHQAAPHEVTRILRELGIVNLDDPFKERKP
jgi:hypothetical protein